MKTYTNGNREIALTERNGKHVVSSNVWDGVKWQYGHDHVYKTLAAAERSAQKMVESISKGWTASATWTISES